MSTNWVLQTSDDAHMLVIFAQTTRDNRAATSDAQRTTLDCDNDDNNDREQSVSRIIASARATACATLLLGRCELLRREASRDARRRCRRSGGGRRRDDERRGDGTTEATAVLRATPASGEVARVRPHEQAVRQSSGDGGGARARARASERANEKVIARVVASLVVVAAPSAIRGIYQLDSIRR